LRVIEDLAGDWRRLDERIEGLSSEIEALARQDKGCERLMTVPGINCGTPALRSIMTVRSSSRPMKSNQRNARNLKIPDRLLALADEVIE
jgi:hypothetical protein